MFVFYVFFFSCSSVCVCVVWLFFHTIEVKMNIVLPQFSSSPLYAFHSNRVQFYVLLLLLLFFLGFLINTSYKFQICDVGILKCMQCVPTGVQDF